MGIRVLFYMTTVIRHFPSARSTFEKKYLLGAKRSCEGKEKYFHGLFF